LKKGNFHAKYSYFGNYKLEKISEITVTATILFKTNHNQNKEITQTIERNYQIISVNINSREGNFLVITKNTSACG